MENKDRKSSEPYITIPSPIYFSCSSGVYRHRLILQSPKFNRPHIKSIIVEASFQTSKPTPPPLLNRMASLLLPLCVLLLNSQLTHGVTHGVISHFPSWRSHQLQHLADIVHHDLRWKYYFTDDGINWQLNFNEILSSPLASDIVSLAGVDGVQFQNATARILRRGDDVAVNRICKQRDQRGTVVIQVLFAPEGANDYGELMFFNEAVDDIDTTIRPAPFSVITFPCTQAYQWQYPAIGTQRGIGFIQYLFVEGGWENEGEGLDNSHHPLSSSDPYVKLSESDFPISITTSFNLTLEKPVFVIDNLFNHKTLADLASHFIESSTYIYNEQDDGGESDNVIFLTPKATYDLVKTRVWSVLERVLEHVSGKGGWYPYDVSNNLNEAWDHTRIHPDCFGRDEYTLLVYLNEEYVPGDLGGTVWYTDEGGEEIIGSVMNRFGRLAVFHCSIPHAARPPHAARLGPRLTFAVKVSPSRAAAVVRTMAESGEINPELEDEEEYEEEYEEDMRRKLEEDLGGDVERLEREVERIQTEFWEDWEVEFGAFLRNVGGEEVDGEHDEL